MKKRDYDSKQRFSIRKLTIGVTSVLLSTLFMTYGHIDTTHAATDTTNTTSSESSSSSSTSSSSSSSSNTSTTSADSSTASSSSAESTTSSDASAESSSSSTSVSSSDASAESSSSSTSAASSDTSAESDATTTKSTSSDSTSSAANSTTADSEKSSETSSSTSSTTSSDTSSLDSSVSALAASTDSTDSISTEEADSSNTRITDSSMTLSQTTIGNDGLSTNIEVVVHVTLKAGDKIKVTFPKGSAYRITSHDSSADGGVISDESNSSTWAMAFSATSSGTYTLHATIGDQSNYTLQSTPMSDIGTHEVAMTLSGTDSEGNSIGTTTKTFTATITPGASPTISRSPSNLTGVKTNTDYTYTLDINEANGVSDSTSYPSNLVNSADNYGTTITVPVPSSFKLDETATNTANNFTDGTTITQAGTGADIIITVPKGAGNQNNSNNLYDGYKLIGSYLTDQPDQNTTLTATSNIVMVQKIDAKGTTVTFNGPTFSETLLAKDSTNVGNVGFSVNGAHSDNSILLKDDEHEYLNQIYISNSSIYNLTDSVITINIPSGFDATSIKIPDKTTDNNQSTNWKYTLTYADGSTSTGSAASGETIKASGSSAIRTAVFEPSEIASGGNGYFYVYGDLAANYDDGTAVKSGDQLTTKITWISNSAGINGTLSGTQTIAAEPITSLQLWTNQATGQIAVYRTGKSSDTTSYVYEPIFYYVLPEHVSYTGKNQWLQGDPTISTFWVNGRQVIKVDYTGTEFKFNTHSNATNSMFVAISALADNGSYPGQVYIYSPHTKMSNSAASAQSTFNSEYTEGHADSNTYLVGNYSFSVSSMSSLSPVAQASGNTQGGVFATNGSSDDKGSTAMDYEIGIKNSTNTDAKNIVVVANLPTNINYQLTGAITADSGTVYYSTKVVSLSSQPDTGDSTTWVTADQVSDWSTIKSVAINVGTVAQGTLSSIYVFKGKDLSLGADGGKTATLKAAMYANGVTNAATTSSSIAISGTSTIKTALQYVDADGQTHTVDLDYTKSYADGTATMKTTDFPDSISGFDSTDQAKIQALIDQGYVFNTSNTTIKNGDKTWEDDETNGTASFGSTVQYYFDGDTVVYVLEQGTTETTETVQRQFTYTDNSSQKTLKDATTGGTSLTVTKSVNKVTGAITYTAVDGSGTSYTVTANDDGTITIANVPGLTASELSAVSDLDGYHLTNSSAAGTGSVTVSFADDATQTAETALTYEPDYQEVNISAHDDTASSSITLPADYTTVFNGKTNAALSTADGLSDALTKIKNYLAGLHYQLDSITFGGKTYTDSDFALASLNFDATQNGAATTDSSPQSIVLNYSHATQAASRNKTVTRTIHYVYEDGTKAFDDVTASQTYTETGTTDLVTNTTTWDDSSWDPASYTFAEVTSQALTGYTPSQAAVAAQTVAVNNANYDDNLDITETVTYTADPQVLDLKVHDQTTNTDLTIPSDYTSSFAGTSKGTVDTDKVNSAIEALKTYYAGLGYVYGSTSDIPSTYDTDDAVNQTVTITLTHKIVTVTPDAPKTPSDQIPDTNQKYPDGVAEDDLNKTITRTINITYPDGKTEIEKQTVKLTRQATVDAVTGAVTYGSWSTGSWNEYALTPKTGYTIKTVTSDGTTSSEVDNASSVAAEDVTSATNDTTVNVTYVADYQQYLLKVVDGDKENEELSLNVPGVTASYDGTTGASLTDSQVATMKSSLKALLQYYQAKGYTIKDEDFSSLLASLSSLEFDSTDNATATTDSAPQYVTLTLNHQKVTVTPDAPKDEGTTIDGTEQTYPSGVSEQDLNKTITRTITVHVPGGSAQVVTQEVKYTRVATVDAVTKTVAYSDWTTSDATWDAYTVPSFSGYTAHVSGSVDSKTVAVTDKDETADITYTADPQELVLKVHDQTTDTDLTIPASYTSSFTGTSNGTVDTASVNSAIDALKAYYAGLGYDYVSTSTIPDAYDTDDETNQTVTVTLKHGSVTVEPTDPKTSSDTIDGTSTKYPDGVGENDLNKTITRTITVVYPDGTTKTTTQQVKYTRTATVDTVTGKITGYSSWTTDNNTWAAYTPETLAGYTAESAPEVTVSSADADSSITLKYTAHNQYLYFAVTDETTNKQLDPTDSGITSHFTGTSNATVDASVTSDFKQLIAYYEKLGYEVVSADSVPTLYDTADDVDQVVNLKLKHKLVTVTADDPKNQGTTIDGTSQTYPDGVAKADLNRTVTRTINIYYPNKTTDQVVQNADFTRSAVVDAVTGAVTYNAWTSADPTWDEYDAKTIDGYSAVPTKYEAQTVTAEDKDATVEITYKPNVQYLTIKLYDKDENNAELAANVDGITNNFSGYSDTAVSSTVGESVAKLISYYEKQGYTLVEQDSVPADYDADDETEQVINVYLAHKLVTVDPTAGKTTTDTIPGTEVNYPAGVAEADLNKSITRTITVHKPNGSTEIVTQTVSYARKAEVDAVTQQITYGDWTVSSQGNLWESYTAPVISGYTADSSSPVSEKTVAVTDSDASVDIYYYADPQNLDVVVTDKTTGETLDPAASEIKVKFVGNSNSAVDTASVDSSLAKLKQYYAGLGYEVVSTDTVPTTYDDDDATDQKVNLVLQHLVVTITADDPKDAGTTIDGTNQTYPAGLTKTDLSKTITRTITVIKPDGTSQTITQPVTYTRTATVDAVTQQVSYSSWTSSDNIWNSYVPEKLAGYTPSQDSVATKTVAVDDSDENVVITYTPDQQKLQILVSDTTTGSTLDPSASGVTTEFTGESDGQVPASVKTSLDQLISYYEAKGYEVASQSDIPANYDTDDATDQTVSLVLKHKYVTVEANDPKNTDDLIDGTSQTYPSGVAESDLNKTITRTIKVNLPKATAITITQPVTYTRHAVVDAVTGEIVYGSWTAENSDDTWDEYNAPTVTGYTALPGTINAKQVAVTDSDASVVIDYSADAQTLVIQVVDDTTGKALDASADGAQSTFSGVTDGAVQTSVSENMDKLISYYESQGYTLVKADSAPKSYDDDDKTEQVVTIHMAHRTITVEPGNPKTTSDTIDGTSKSYPDGVAESDLNKTITRTINVTDPDGKTTTITQVVKYQRSASFDAVDPATITYGDWQLASDSNTWEAFNPTAISGYTPSQSIVEAKTVAASDGDAVVNITYAADPQQLTIAITDQTTGKALTAPSEIPTSFTGNSNGNVGTEPSSSLSSLISYYEGLGYELVSAGSVPEKYDTDDAVDQVINLVLKHKTVTVTADNPKTSSDPIDGTKVNYPAGVSASDLNKTITRTITITYPDGTTETVTQPVNYTRTATVDAVTGDVSYSEWTSGDNIWDKYTPEAVAGYTPSQSVVDSKSVAASDSNSTVAITYTPNTQKLAIVVKDADGNTLNTDGSGITTSFTGDSDSSVGSEVSDSLKSLTAYYKGLGYQIVSTSTLPTTYDHDDKTDQTVKVTVKARIIPVSADDPKTSADKISGTNRNYPEGVGESDLNKVITRTINVTDPDGSTKTITQTVKYARNAIVNAVTGEVTYSAWTSDNALWDVYEAPAIPGYKASQYLVNGQEVTPDMEDQTVDITYAAQAQNLKFVATDETTGQTIDLTKSGITTSFTGNSNDAIPTEASQARQKLIDYLESLGYKVEAGSLPSKFDTDTSVDQTVSFNLTHKTESAQETKTITRTIKITNPDGTTQTITQPVKFTRTKTTDLVTKESTYTAWTSDDSQWSSVTVPTIPGYTASQNAVASQEVTPDMEDQTVDITYAAQPQNLKFVATDETTGQTIDLTKSGITTSFTGNSNGAIPTEASQARQKLIDYLESLGYKVEAGSLPSKFDTDAGVDQTVSFNLTHKTESAQETKTITRTISLHQPDGSIKTITQPVKFTRTKTTDLVTKESTYTAWTSDDSQWASVTVPTIPGYTASQNTVAGENVTVDMEDQTVDITYAAQPQNLKFVATDETTGQTIDLTKSGITTNFTGNSNGAIPTEASQARQKLIDYLESLGYKVEAGSLPTKFDTDAGVDQTVSFNLTHKTESAQETKTITRTIRLHQPNGSVKEIKQTVVFTRTKTTDLVTKEDTYTAWTSENSQWASIIVPTISGYQASIKVVKAANVTSDAENEIIDVTYSAIKPAKPAPTPKQPAKPQPKDNGRANAASPSKQPNQSEGQNELPQTGENNAAASVGILSMLLGLLGIGFERRRKRR